MHFLKKYLPKSGLVLGCRRGSGEGFTVAHWFLPEELKYLTEKHGIQTPEMAGLEGLSSHHRRKTNKLSKDPEKWNLWLKIILETCTRVVVGGTEHILLVGRKRK